MAWRARGHHCEELRGEQDEHLYFFYEYLLSVLGERETLKRLFTAAAVNVF